MIALGRDSDIQRIRRTNYGRSGRIVLENDAGSQAVFSVQGGAGDVDANYGGTRPRLQGQVNGKRSESL
jgi:hypothetical protein